MSLPVIYWGPQAFPSFRLEQINQYIQQRVQRHDQGVEYTQYVCRAHLIYILALSAEHSEFNDLLSAQPVTTLPHRSLVVMPRAGTVSAWASKVGDIVRACHIAQMKSIEMGICYELHPSVHDDFFHSCASVLYDRMTEDIIFPADMQKIYRYFQYDIPRQPLRHIKNIAVENQQNHWGLSSAEITYLEKCFDRWQRAATDAEMMMYTQVNSEHCRHKIFNAHWQLDNVLPMKSPMDMIRLTYRCNPENIYSAYRDNAAVIGAHLGHRFFPAQGHYTAHPEKIDMQIKVETHNHPTAISPFPGAGTGVGGELRDEAAVGKGGKQKAGLVGFSVSHLRLADFPMPWEPLRITPPHLAPASEIMLQAPLGGAAFNNEFGRVNLCGYFRTFESWTDDTSPQWSYDKPIMIAGGFGNIRRRDIAWGDATDDMVIIVLGGPANRIGIGGGSASSSTIGGDNAQLDFSSVQRQNPQMQRRCQEVIDTCWQKTNRNPIIRLHDVGAGGLSNAVTELLHDLECGGKVYLARLPTDDPSLSPMEMWCNEAQERYVVAISHAHLTEWQSICQRESCPWAQIGHTIIQQQLTVYDENNNTVIDFPLAALFEQQPKIDIPCTRLIPPPLEPLSLSHIDVSRAAKKVLQVPAVAAKHFLVHIGDRTVGGMSYRDQCVGPWQIPVADAASTASDYVAHHGEAMAMGERTPIGASHAPSAARMAIGEAITNIACMRIRQMQDIKLSANWMVAVDAPHQSDALYESVRTVATELCPQLGVCIPVGKDSLSMATQWQQDDQHYDTKAPLSLIVSAFAPTHDLRGGLTPQLSADGGHIFFIDLAQGKQRMGRSALAQAHTINDGAVPDLENAALLVRFFAAIQDAAKQGGILAYHDRSDGGIFACICEMCFAARLGVDIDIAALGDNDLSILFNEELGAVVQATSRGEEALIQCFSRYAVPLQFIGRCNGDDEIRFHRNQSPVLTAPRRDYHRWWQELSYQMQKLRDNPDCAREEWDGVPHKDTLGIFADLSFDYVDYAPPLIKKVAPRVAILREQGVNGQYEMAAAFTRAGFTCIDVHTNDIINGECDLAEYQGLAICGGFSFGDVLGAGKGWAEVIQRNPRCIEALERFFVRPTTFTLGVCNGCHVLSYLRDWIEGATHWPTFTYNRSRQFESRLSMVEILPSSSIFFMDMVGSKMPIAVAHGEGYAEWASQQNPNQSHAVLRFIDGYGQPTQQYPANPNGSAGGLTGFCSADGRVTIMMPHPERVFRTMQYSWHPPHWGEDAPWMHMFGNARRWVG